MENGNRACCEFGSGLPTGIGSSRYSRIVLRTAEITMISNIPEMPSVPATSKSR